MKKIFIILTILLNVIYLKSQSCTDVEEWLRKRHTISNMTYGHPYTTFDRHNQKSLSETIKIIRNRIISESPDDVNGQVFQAYKAIYNNAIKAMPSDNGMSNEAVSELALWAKDNAFVFLVGLDGNGELIYKQFKTTLYENSKSSQRHDNQTI